MAVGDPLFILAPHRSYTSVINSMIGQHPQLYGLPEMNLFVTESMWDWWLSFGRGRAIGAHGPLRVVAQLFGGVQNEQTINQAWGWMRQRLQQDSCNLLREIADQVGPRAIVDKSPTTAYQVGHMDRVLRCFPNARFLHLVRHPLGHGKSVVRSFDEFDRFNALPHSLRRILSGEASPPSAEQLRRAGREPDEAGLFDYSVDPPVIDPQIRWHQLHVNICEFYDRLPEERRLRIAGEDFMDDVDLHLQQITEWMGIRSDEEALDEMKHPERSPYACFGPTNAHLGNDPFFLENPVLDNTRSRSEQSLEGPVPWRSDGAGFKDEVKELARQFGYD